MGVPGFVAWLYNNHKNSNFIFKQLYKSSIDNISSDNDHNEPIDLDKMHLESDVRIDSVQHLLIDANCLIHPQARQVCIDNANLVESKLELLERKIIKQCISYIETIINQVKPTESIYIAVDGVAPMAKIKHQRLRRFKSVYDRRINENLLKKHKKPVSKEWNTSAITPGTIFMDKLMNHILQWINMKKFDCKVVFSSSYTPGEGEHKLLQYMKNQNISPKSNTVIYGLDADLLFLSLASEINNIYLMRETSQMEMNGSHHDSGFSYLSINILKDVINTEMISRLGSDKEWDIKQIVNDFVFLCYFCGNDFIPTIPSLTIKPHSNKITNGIDTIIDTYCSVVRSYNEELYVPEYLIKINKFTSDTNTTYQTDKKIQINQPIFIEILSELAEQETAYYNDHFKYKRYIRFSNSNDQYDVDKHAYEENIIPRFNDPIELGDPATSLAEWKYKYYLTYYNIEIDKSDSYDYKLNNILESYTQGLIWTLYYYYDECKDYEWFFEHHHGPFISDLLSYITLNPSKLEHFEELYSMNGIWFRDQIKPLQQLMLVLPHESSFLIPASYRNLMFSNVLSHYFPERIIDIKMDYLYKNKAWQNIPMIEIIPAKTIIKLTSKVILKDEDERNQTYCEIVKNK